MAVSDRDLPAGIDARLLQERELNAALALSRNVGWNQVAADWRIFFELGSATCLTRANVPIATAATLPYAGRFAWISMVIVAAVERRQGLARWLLRHSIEGLLTCNLMPMLDATPAGRAVYLGLGFRDCWAMRRLVGRAVQPPPIGDSVATTIRPLDASDWPQVIAYDAAVFGADRGVLLRRLAERLPRAALVAEHGGRIRGVLLGRDGRVMNQLGPLVADDDGVAMALLARAIAAVPAPLTVDVPDRHFALGDWLTKQSGFEAERPLIRMAYGTETPFDDGARLFAIAGPELG